jgi:hypothetical protein
MRSGLFLLLIGIPGAAMATEDRYGPARAPDPALALVSARAAEAPRSGYNGQLLNWSGRSESVSPAPVSGPVQPPKPVQAATAAAPARYAAATPVASAAASLPKGLYDGAAPAPAPAPVGTSAPQAYVASAQPPTPSAAPVAAYGSPWGDYRPRAYSVVREYGGTPDRIPAPPPQSAFTGPEISLAPGLLGSSPDNTPPADDDADDQPVRRPAKDAR